MQSVECVYVLHDATIQSRPAARFGEQTIQLVLSNGITPELYRILPSRGPGSSLKMGQFSVCEKGAGGLSCIRSVGFGRPESKMKNPGSRPGQDIESDESPGQFMLIVNGDSPTTASSMAVSKLLCVPIR